MESPTKTEIENALNQRGAVIEPADNGRYSFKMWGTQSDGSPILRLKLVAPDWQSAVDAAEAHLQSIGQ
jgi:hypothetical protein